MSIHLVLSTNAINYLKVQKRQHILYFDKSLKEVPLVLSCKLHHLSLSSLCDCITFSPMMILQRCLYCRDNAATPLPKSRPRELQSRLITHQNETANIGRRVNWGAKSSW